MTSATLKPRRSTVAIRVVCLHAFKLPISMIIMAITMIVIIIIICNNNDDGYTKSYSRLLPIINLQRLPGHPSDRGDKSALAPVAPLIRSIASAKRFCRKL